MKLAPASRLRVPLWTRIFLLLLLNLALVGAVLYGFARAQFHFGLDSLLAGQAGERIEAVAGVISAELGNGPKSGWDGILRRFSANYRVHFAVYRERGGQLAGEPLELPADVRAKMDALGPPAPPRGGPPHGPHGPPRAGEHGGPWDRETDGFDGPPPGGFDDGNRPRHEPDFDGDGPGGGDGPPDSPDGRRREREPGTPPVPPRGGPGQPRFLLRTGQPPLYWMVIRLPVRAIGLPHGGGPVTLVAASSSLDGGGLFFDPMPWLAVAAGCLAVSGLCWLPLAHGITRAIGRLTRATERIAEGRFDVRLAEGRRDELGALAGAVNRMAARLEGFVTGQKRFLGDTAHELCAPLARLQLSLGILEQRAEDDPSLAHPVADLREEVEEMSALVNELLSFSKASLARSSVRLRPVELRPLIEQAARREEAGGAAPFEVDAPAGLAALGDPELLLRALSNLLRNAVRYAGGAGPIRVAAAREGGRAVLRVNDRGPGIPAEALARIFDPFYRVDVSRDRATGGTGLGLAIVKTCVEACGGTAACQTREGGGLEVTLSLTPADAAPPAEDAAAMERAGLLTG